MTGGVVAAGTLLGERYRLDERIAAGGMGEVWRATDLVLDRAVAVKLLCHGFAEEGEELARFRAEARHAGSLSHPGIAQIYDYHEADPPAVPYLVMELVDGPSLSRLLADGPLEPARTMDLVAQAAWALQAAHAAGLVHRDIKPGNLLVNQAGQVKVTDFGISHAEGAEPLTRTGVLVGTPAYLAPEQAAGAHATPASDLYSLGIVAFHCLTGSPPFSGAPLAIALAHQERSLPPLPASVPVGVAALVADLTAKDPRTRPPGAAVVARRAEQLRESLIATRELGIRGRRRSWQSAYAAAAAVAVAAVAATGWIITGVHGDPQSTTGQTTTGHPATGPAATAHASPSGSHPAQHGTHPRKTGVTTAAVDQRRGHGAVPAHSPTSKPVSAATPTPSATSSPTQPPASSTPTPTPTPTPTSGTSSPTATPTSSTPTPTPTGTATPTGSPASSPPATPTPTATSSASASTPAPTRTASVPATSPPPGSGAPGPSGNPSGSASAPSGTLASSTPTATGGTPAPSITSGLRRAPVASGTPVSTPSSTG